MEAPFLHWRTLIQLSKTHTECSSDLRLVNRYLSSGILPVIVVLPTRLAPDNAAKRLAGVLCFIILQASFIIGKSLLRFTFLFDCRQLLLQLYCRNALMTWSSHNSHKKHLILSLFPRSYIILATTLWELCKIILSLMINQKSRGLTNRHKNLLLVASWRSKPPQTWFVISL